MSGKLWPTLFDKTTISKLIDGKPLIINLDPTKKSNQADAVILDPNSKLEEILAAIISVRSCGPQPEKKQFNQKTASTGT